MKTTKECPACGVVFTRRRTSYKKPIYCSRSCANKAPGRMTDAVKSKISKAATAQSNPNWGGGSWVSNEGRVFIRVPLSERHLHPTIRKDGYIQRYQYVWNTHHPDNPVREGDVIHHINENPADDRIENLKKTSQSEHAREHGLGRTHAAESLALMSRVQLARRAREREERNRGVR